LPSSGTRRRGAPRSILRAAADSRTPALRSSGGATRDTPRRRAAGRPRRCADIARPRQRMPPGRRGRSCASRPEAPRRHRPRSPVAYGVAAAGRAPAARALAVRSSTPQRARATSRGASETGCRWLSRTCAARCKTVESRPRRITGRAGSETLRATCRGAARVATSPALSKRLLPRTRELCICAAVGRRSCRPCLQRF
jgi:hypothetical protein